MKNIISTKRLKILKEIRTFINTNKDDTSPLEYPCTWFLNRGYQKVKSLYDADRVQMIFQFFKELFLISSLSTYKTFRHQRINFKNKDTLVISWFTKNDFDKNNYYRDKYIPLKQSNKTISFLLNVGKFFDPVKSKNPNCIFYQKTKDRSFNFLFLIRSIFIYFFHRDSKLLSMSVYSEFSYLVTKEILKILKNNNFKNVVMPYEAQPFQKHVISEIRKKYKKIKIISFLSAMQPFPIHLHDNKIIPDINNATSPAQIKQLTEIFNWDKKKIKLIKAHRFQKGLTEKYKNKLVLPYFINGEKNIYENIYKLLDSSPKKFFSQISIAAHPAGFTDNKYMRFVKLLEDMIESFDAKFDKKTNKNQSLIVGSTSTIFEALEYKLKVFHIVNEPVLEALDSLFWPTIKIKKFNKNILIYQTKFKKKLIHY